MTAFNTILLTGFFAFTSIAWGTADHERTIRSFISWHDQTHGEKKSKPTLNELKKFFAGDVHFVVNDVTRAKNIDEVLKMYETMFSSPTHTWFKSPITEIAVSQDQAILRFDQRIVTNKNLERSLKAMVFTHFNKSGLIDRFIEVFTFDSNYVPPTSVDDPISGFVAWHNRYYRQNIDNKIEKETLGKYFSNDVHFEVNGKVIASNLTQLVTSYEKIKAKGRKLVDIERFDSEHTNKLGDGTIEVAVEHDVTLVAKDGVKTILKAKATFMVKNGKIFKYVEAILPAPQNTP